ncbi:NAD-dependent epimerase/dehydratase family protein [Candidatus Acetothermia bacterium]|nr:NAD-dependent epimerase/dehydratase family protein [Candidatus Acetothermia bacterium]MBI3659056.1 NAD-dependent epimerase/dehydratase family protein [Candidatus Acetothermia bacterium]
MKILVTGATGLIGSHIAEKLLAQKQDVRVLVRDPQKANFLKTTGAELVLGDTLDPDTLERALKGVHTVYHCAALVQLQGTRDRLLNINVQGTGNMLEASLAANVKRFIFTSSVAVYGSANDPQGTREDDPQAPNGPYSESKIESEKLVWQAYREKGFPISIIRPCVVYGPRDLNFSKPLLKNLKGLMPMVRHGEALLDLVHVRDVADVHLLAGTNEKAVGQAYNVTDGEPHTIQELVETVRRLANLNTRFINLPYPVVLTGATIAYEFARMRGKMPLISPSTVRAMAIHHHYSIEKAQEHLGFVPKVKLEEGWKETIEWFQARSR